MASLTDFQKSMPCNTWSGRKVALWQLLRPVDESDSFRTMLVSERNLLIRRNQMISDVLKVSPFLTDYEISLTVEWLSVERDPYI